MSTPHLTQLFPYRFKNRVHPLTSSKFFDKIIKILSKKNDATDTIGKDVVVARRSAPLTLTHCGPRRGRYSLRFVFLK